MPNIYYSSPSVPFASATQGFLANLKDFQKLDLQRQALEAKEQALQQDVAFQQQQEERRTRALDIQEQNALIRQARFALDQSKFQQRMEAIQLQKGLADVSAQEAIEGGILTPEEYENIYTPKITMGQMDAAQFDNELERRADEMVGDGIYKQKWEVVLSGLEAQLSSAEGDSPMLMQAKEGLLKEVLKTRSLARRKIQMRPEEFQLMVMSQLQGAMDQSQAQIEGAAATVEALRGLEGGAGAEYKSFDVLPEPKQIEIRETLLQAAVKAGSLDDLNRAIHEVVTREGVAPDTELLAELYQAFQSRIFRKAEKIIEGGPPPPYDPDQARAEDAADVGGRVIPPKKKVNGD